VALSEDQKAMIRLLAQREQGYDDIAALMGLSVEEVRSKVKDALAELERSGQAVELPPEPPPSPPPPPPAPEPTSPPVEPTPAEPEAQTPPPAPTPEPPKEPTPATPPPAATTPPKAESPKAPKATVASRLPLPKDRDARLGLYAGVAVVVIFVVLLVTGAFGGGSDSSTTSSGGESTEGSTTTTGNETGEGKQPTGVVLRPVNGGDAIGRAIFGRVKNQALLVIQAKGLEPSPQGQSYAISLARSPSERVPIVATKVGKDGTIAGQYKISTRSLGLLSVGFDQMEVSLVSNSELRSALEAANKEGKAPVYSGTDVLRGSVTGPIVDAAKKEEGEG
jgi:hypothetical protein